MFAILWLAGALIRFCLFLSPKSLWESEWFSIEMARNNVWQIIAQNAVDVHPPLYFLVLHAFIQSLGFHEWVFRLPSLLAGVATIAAVYLAASEIFDKKTAQWTIYFTAIAPFFVHLSQEIRSHGFTLLFCSFGTFFFWKSWKNPAQKKWGWAYVAVSAVALYTVHFAWFWLFGILLFHGLNFKKNPAFRKIATFQATLFGLALPTIALLIYQTVQGHELTAGYEGLAGYSVLTIVKESLIVYWHFINGPEFYMHWSSLVTHFLKTSPLFWLSVISFFTAIALIFKELSKLKKQNESPEHLSAFFTITCFAPVLVMALVSPGRLEPKYFGFAAPFLWMLISKNLAETKSRFYALAVAGLFSVVLLHGDLFMIRLPTDPVYRENYLEMSKYVLKNSEKDDAIRDVGIFGYYREKMGTRPQGSLVGDFEISKEEARQYRRFWLLNGEMTDSSVFEAISAKMKQNGFEPDGKEIIFGDTGSRAILNLFKRND